MISRSKPAALACVRCGVAFSCAADSGDCWCFDVPLDAEQLGALRRASSAASCLCPACLTALATSPRASR